ncbi:hypothetical protein EYF80_042872 [Liparis tanakae]|uniref:Uncharacterized protein n=1 Tax=Liparis tanakae TaxID=230148 RepID=A0A4Z2G253_9TELE|nr:hypothetical protein EYF80_042872 [Liparis tanakae]
MASLLSLFVIVHERGEPAQYKLRQPECIDDLKDNGLTFEDRDWLLETNIRECTDFLSELPPHDETGRGANIAHCQGGGRFIR